ncbi:MAG: PepSY domain-containing protein [Daejeonella sp.]
MKKIFLTAICIAIAGVTAFAQTADEVVNKNITAMGGKEKLNSLKSVKMEGTLEVQGMQIPTTMVMLNNKGMRNDFTLQGMTGSQVITDKGGWMFMPFQGQQKPEPTPAEEVKASQVDLDLASPLVDYSKKGHQVTYLGEEDMDGTQVYKLRLDTKDGVAITYYVDAETGYIIKSSTKKKIGEKETNTVVLLSNYKKTDDGYVFPYTFEQSAEGAGKIMINLSKIEINVPVDESIFVMPAK